MVAVSRNDSEIVNLDDAREGGYDFVDAGV